MTGILARLRPLEPIFDPGRERGSIQVGNTPGIEDPQFTFQGSINDATRLAGAQAVAISGNYAYVLATDYVNVVDISNPASPSIVEDLNDTTYGGVYDCAIVGTKLYSTHPNLNRVVVTDISNPLAISLSTSLTDASNLDEPRQCVVDGDFLYTNCNAASPNGDLAIVDITTTPPTIEGTLALGAGVTISKSGNYVFADSGNLRVVNVSNPASPSLAATMTTPTITEAWQSILNDNIFISDATDDEIHVIDVSTPTSPTARTGSPFTTAGTELDFCVGSDFYGTSHLIVAAQFSDRLTAINIQDPDALFLTDSVTHASLDAVRRVAVSGNTVVGVGSGWVSVWDFS